MAMLGSVRFVDRGRDVSFGRRASSVSTVSTGALGSGQRRKARSLHRAVLLGVFLALTSVTVVPAVGAATKSTSGVKAVFVSFSDVSCGTPGHCVVLGNTDSTPARFFLATTNDGGSRWVLHSSLPRYVYQLSQVVCLTARDCMAIGGGDIVRTTNDWVTSEDVSSALDATAISCPNVSDCTAVGQSGFQEIAMLATTRNAGATWKTLTFPSLRELDLVTCPTANDCTAFGTYADGHTGPQYLATTDGGVKWTRHNVSLGLGPFGAIAMSCSTSRDCVVSGPGPEHGEIAFTHNDGMTWRNGDIAVPDGTILGDYEAVSCSSSSDCTAVGGSVIDTTDGGATWTLRVPFGKTEFGTVYEEYLDTVSCPTSKYCMAASIGSASFSGAVITTTDGGITWTRLTNLPR